MASPGLDIPTLEAIAKSLEINLPHIPADQRAQMAHSIHKDALMIDEYRETMKAWHGTAYE